MLAACHLVRLLMLAYLEIPLNKRGQLTLLPLLLLLFGILLLPALALLPVASTKRWDGGVGLACALSRVEAAGGLGLAWAALDLSFWEATPDSAAEASP